ncbi:hypothetical protein V8C86DRAFT_1242121 [Haematococcus lacustris]
MHRYLGAALLVACLLLLAPLTYVLQESKGREEQLSGHSGSSQGRRLHVKASQLPNAQLQPQPGSRVYSLLETAQRLLNLPVSAQRKRIALLRALAGHNATHQQQHDLPNVAAAFLQTLASLGQHMPCRWVLHRGAPT